MTDDEMMAEVGEGRKIYGTGEGVFGAEEEGPIDRGEHEARVKEQMATDVKSKISNLLSGDREIIGYKDALRYLAENLSPGLAAILCSLSARDFAAFARKNGKRMPSALQRRNISAAYVVADILLSRFPGGMVQDWFVGYDEYLYGVPAIELSRRPEDVRIAAMHLIAGGG